MKTFKQLKSLIDFCQTDAFFLSYMEQLRAAGVITLEEGDIDAESKTVSDEFYVKMAEIYGIELDDELNPLINNAVTGDGDVGK